MHQWTARRYYQLHSEQIERWLDLAVYHPTARERDVPHKVSARCTRSQRRAALVRDQLRLARLVDLTGSRRVLDVGAGFGDFTIFARDFQLERLDALEPAPLQHQFLCQRWCQHDRVHDLPLERMSIGDYDTVVLMGLWVPDWVEALRDHILVPGVERVVLDVITSMTTRVGAGHAPAGTWRYCRTATHQLYSAELLHSVFKNRGFHRERAQARITQPGTQRLWLSYRRDTT